MFYLYVAYGFVFLAAGVLIAFQARLPGGIMSKPVQWWLAGFCLAHGLSEWAALAVLMLDSTAVVVPVTAFVLRLASFVCLAQFGSVVLAARAPRARRRRAVPVILGAAWLAIAIAAVARYGFHHDALRVADSAGRYVIALPGALLAAAALHAAAKEQTAVGQPRIGRRLQWATIAFLLYAILAGAIVPPAPFFPATVFNTNGFAAATHVPVEVFRILVAAVIASAISEAFVIEAARAHADWERKREELIAVVAHDLRSPIGAIHLAAEVLGAGITKDPERVAKLACSIRTAADALERMVADLLDASRLETHQLVLDRRDVELRSLVNDVVDRTRHITAGHPVRTALPQATMNVHADPTRVEQVLANLLSNAAKYSAPQTEIVVGVTSHPYEVEVAVTNYGSTLTPEDARQMFTRFYRGKAQRGRTEGLGLGLYIASGLVQAHGGRIWIDSVAGESATVHFTLPHAQGRSASTTVPSEALSRAL